MTAKTIFWDSDPDFGSNSEAVKSGTEPIFSYGDYHYGTLRGLTQGNEFWPRANRGGAPDGEMWVIQMCGAPGIIAEYDSPKVSCMDFKIN